MMVSFPKTCNACGQPLLLENVFCEDGCPCNSPRGVNVPVRDCSFCMTECARPAHRIIESVESEANREFTRRVKERNRRRREGK